MAEFFLELFTEEIPYRLQSEARSNLKKTVEKIFEDKKIDFKFVKVSKCIKTEIFEIDEILKILFEESFSPNINKQL